MSRFDPLNQVTIKRAILWQYESAERLGGIIADEDEYYREKTLEFWVRWLYGVFDVRYADEFGLAVWARILAMPFTVASSQNSGAKWAFGTDRENFERGNFGTSGSSAGVSVETLRILVMLRIVQLTERPIAPRLNRRFAEISRVTRFQRFYVVDNQDMTISYWFTRPLSQELTRALDIFNVLPRPSGVGFDINIVPQDAYFGFGVDDNNFDGGFAPDANV